MKDAHLIDALKRALEQSARRRSHALDLDREGRRRRSDGWVTIADIEANQAPNTYPRFGKRAIRERCEALSHQQGPPFVRVDRGLAGLRTWVRLEAAPVEVAPVDVVPIASPEDVEAFSGIEVGASVDEAVRAEADDRDPPPATA